MISNGGRAEDGLRRRETMVKSKQNPFTFDRGFGRRAFESKGVVSVDEDGSVFEVSVFLIFWSKFG